MRLFFGSVIGIVLRPFQLFFTGFYVVVTVCCLGENSVYSFFVLRCLPFCVPYVICEKLNNLKKKKEKEEVDDLVFRAHTILLLG